MAVLDLDYAGDSNCQADAISCSPRPAASSKSRAPRKRTFSDTQFIEVLALARAGTINCSPCRAGAGPVSHGAWPRADGDRHPRSGQETRLVELIAPVHRCRRRRQSRPARTRRTAPPSRPMPSSRLSAASQAAQLPALADDSGVIVAALERRAGHLRRALGRPQQGFPRRHEAGLRRVTISTSPDSSWLSALRNCVRSVLAPLAVSRNTLSAPACAQPPHLRLQRFGRCLRYAGVAVDHKYENPPCSAIAAMSRAP